MISWDELKGLQMVVKDLESVSRKASASSSTSEEGIYT